MKSEQLIKALESAINHNNDLLILFSSILFFHHQIIFFNLSFAKNCIPNNLLGHGRKSGALEE